MAYSIKAKNAILNVERNLLDTHGPVSQPVALAMAHGVQKLTGADLAIATTGLAGPDGGSADLPIGLYYVAAVGLGQELWLSRQVSGDRGQVVEAATLSALELLETLLNRPTLA